MRVTRLPNGEQIVFKLMVLTNGYANRSVGGGELGSLPRTMKQKQPYHKFMATQSDEVSTTINSKLSNTHNLKDKN